MRGENYGDTKKRNNCKDKCNNGRNSQNNKRKRILRNRQIFTRRHILYTRKSGHRKNKHKRDISKSTNNQKDKKRWKNNKTNNIQN